jgi:uncharacterized protein with von Willebrand factor type A (vWA) domain
MASRTLPSLSVSSLPGPAARMAGFLAHLRLNGFAAGPAETVRALDVLQTLGAADADGARRALKTLLCGRRQEWDRFEALFDAYWYGHGVRRAAPAEPDGRVIRTRGPSRPKIWDRTLPSEEGPSGESPSAALDGAEDEAEGEGTGRLIASRQDKLRQIDLRHIVDPDEIAAAERLALRLAAAIRYRLSRRRRITNDGPTLDLRRTIRASLGHGGEPIDLAWRKRPERPVRIVVLLDVSGSMQAYSRFFLQFVSGLIGHWLRAEAFLFHTRLARVTAALRDKDVLRAMARLSLMTEGFGGGTAIGKSLHVFNTRYAREVLDSRTVVIIMSDGYDTDPPEVLEREMKRLTKRARRIVWLNPLLGWRDYAPVARGMAAALPYIDCFRAANTLDGMARLEADLARL